MHPLNRRCNRCPSRRPAARRASSFRVTLWSDHPKETTSDRQNRTHCRRRGSLQEKRGIARNLPCSHCKWIVQSASGRRLCFLAHFGTRFRRRQLQGRCANRDVSAHDLSGNIGSAPGAVNNRPRCTAIQLVDLAVYDDEVTQRCRAQGEIFTTNASVLPAWV